MPTNPIIDPSAVSHYSPDSPSAVPQNATLNALRRNIAASLNSEQPHAHLSLEPNQNVIAEVMEQMFSGKTHIDMVTVQLAYPSASSLDILA